MTESQIIECASTQDMLIKATQLADNGIEAIFLPNCTLQIVPN